MVFYQVIARFQNFGLYHNKKRSGRLRKTSPHDDNLIRQVAALFPFRFCKNIGVTLPYNGTDVHCTTVSKRLVHDFNLKAFKLAKNLV